MEFSYEGIGQVVATFAKGTNVQPGMAVSLTSNDTVSVGDDGSALCGVVLAVDGDCCAVQVGGFVQVPVGGADALLPGVREISVNGKGKIRKAATTGLRCMVVRVDEENGTAIIKL